MWGWFWDLNRRRQHGLAGPQPLTYAELDRWSALTGTALLREEVGLLLELDDAFLAALGDERPKPKPKAEKFR